MSKIYLAFKGLSGMADNSDKINRALEGVPEGTTVVFPDGTFPVTKTIIQNKTLHWEGGDNTILQASSPIIIAHFKNGNKSIINRINFKSNYSIWSGQDTPQADGVLVSSIVYMRDCLVRNVYGNGVTVSADIAHGTGNASASRFDNLNVIECRNNGIYFQGGDANQCGVYHADIRDCNGVGLWDNSFLGNQFFGCMTHNNKGSYKAGDETDLDNQNSRAGFFGCYAEGGQGPIIMCGHSMWYGGLPSDGFSLFNYAKTFL